MLLDFTAIANRTMFPSAVLRARHGASGHARRPVANRSSVVAATRPTCGGTDVSDRQQEGHDPDEDHDRDRPAGVADEPRSLPGAAWVARGAAGRRRRIGGEGKRP